VRRLMLRYAAVGVAFLAALSQANGAQSFDGYWGVSLDCPNDPGGATGYNLEFRAEVKDNVLHGQYGAPGTAGSFSLDGKIQSDGSASMDVKGRTGEAFRSVGRVPPNSPYGYGVTAHFEGSQGTGSRVGGRVCRFRFTKS
jgi:hypothetical protein